jgi:hypothetical protein
MSRVEYTGDVTRREQASDTSADLLVVDTLDERAATNA